MILDERTNPERFASQTKLEGGVNESLVCKGKGKRTNTGPRC